MVKPERVLSRKQRRKEERRFKKAKKHSFFTKKSPQESKQSNQNPPAPDRPQVPVKSNSKPKKKSLSPEEIRRRQLKVENDREDRNIRMLEKKMNINRRKQKTVPRSFVEDGLAYILEACDPETVKNMEPEVDFLDKDNSDFEDEDIGGGGEKKESNDVTLNKNNKRRLDDLSDEEMSKEKRQKELKKVTWKEELESFEEMDISENGDECDPDEDDDILVSDDKEDDSESGSNDEMGDDCVENNHDSKLWEDIYGRMRDKKGNIVKAQDEKYIPPSKRVGNVDSEKIQRLKKQLKGLLNRLSEANVKPISSQMEDLYQTNSRNDMNETLTQLIFAAVVQPSLTPERLVQEHAMLIALLHANVGSEVGAHFLQVLAVKFDEIYKNNDCAESKELHNILLLLAYLYSFKIVHSLLMMNLLQYLAEKFSPLDLELILLLLKNIGFSLRKDDPIMLKEIILTLQSKANSTVMEGENENRVRFMLETLMAIRNNNMNKIPNYDPSHLEHLKKLLRGLVRKGCVVVELRISLEDLFNAETKGRWWIVGSSWNGDQVEQKDGATSKRKNILGTDSFNEKILELAKQQRMNTDIRRNIFCIIMTAEDCDDCFEKLMRLGLHNQQEREIVHVIIHCCLNEASYNHYYTLLSTKFCKYDRKFQMTFQCTFWDHFKNLTNLKESQTSNLAQLLSNLLLSQSLCISLLKVIHFSEMEKHLVHFLRQLFVRILLHETDEELQAVFQRISTTPKLRMLREGTSLFLRHFVLRHQGSLDADKKQLEDKVNDVERILLTADLTVQL